MWKVVQKITYALMQCMTVLLLIIAKLALARFLFKELLY